MLTMPISIIIPVLNEEKNIEILLQQLQEIRQEGNEVIVVDGGSIDDTVSIAKMFSDKVIKSKSGRALQMNSGASVAAHDALWFLHADTLIPDTAMKNIQQVLNKNDWGRFDIRLSGSNFLFRIIERLINIRSCLTGIATGDQAIIVKKNVFDAVEGYPAIPLMEDIELSYKLRKISKPICIKNPLITSSRRWEKNGIFSTILLMWRLRFLYWFGVSAEKLASQYK